MVPADDVGRAKAFYQSLPGWKIEPDTTLEKKTLEWQNITTGEPEPGRMNAGGLWKPLVQGPGALVLIPPSPTHHGPHRLRILLIKGIRDLAGYP